MRPTRASGLLFLATVATLATTSSTTSTAPPWSVALDSSWAGCVERHNAIVATPAGARPLRNATFVLVKPTNGLGNELLSITSAFVLACLTRRALVVKLSDARKWELYTSPLDRINDTSLVLPPLHAGAGKLRRAGASTFIVDHEAVLCQDLRVRQEHVLVVAEQRGAHAGSVLPYT